MSRRRSSSSPSTLGPPLVAGRRASADAAAARASTSCVGGGLASPPAAAAPSPAAAAAAAASASVRAAVAEHARVGGALAHRRARRRLRERERGRLAHRARAGLGAAGELLVERRDLPLERVDELELLREVLEPRRPQHELLVLLQLLAELREEHVQRRHVDAHELVRRALKAKRLAQLRHEVRVAPLRHARGDRVLAHRAARAGLAVRHRSSGWGRSPSTVRAPPLCARLRPRPAHPILLAREVCRSRPSSSGFDFFGSEDAAALAAPQPAVPPRRAQR